jgi:DnaJ-class molecular chaperone
MNNLRPYHVHIREIIETPYAPGGSYEIDFVSFAEPTMEEARAHAARTIDSFVRKVTSRRIRVVYFLACDTCKVTGKKPGCKRKICPACAGNGTTEIVGAS